MDQNNNIYRSENPKPEDVERLNGFVSALKESGSIPSGATTEEAISEINRLRAQGALRQQTKGAFGVPVKP